MNSPNQILGVDIIETKLPSLFATCVTCFDFAIKATSSLQLGVLRNRLTRWGQAVHIYDDEDLILQGAEIEDLENIRSCIVQMLSLFARVFQEVQSPTRQFRPHQVTFPVLAALNSIAAGRSSKGKTALTSQGWEVVHWPDDLLQILCGLMKRLEDVLPSTRARSELCALERIKLSKGGTLGVVEAAASGLDPLMEPSVSKATTLDQALADLQSVIGNSYGMFGSKLKSGIDILDFLADLKAREGVYNDEFRDS